MFIQAANRFPPLLLTLALFCPNPSAAPSPAPLLQAPDPAALEREQLLQEEIRKLLEKAEKTTDLDLKLRLLKEVLAKADYNHPYAASQLERVQDAIAERDARRLKSEGERSAKSRLVAAADQAYQAGDYKEAIRGYEEALRLEDDPALRKKIEFARAELASRNQYWWFRLVLILLAALALAGLAFFWWTKRVASLVIDHGPDRGKKLKLDARETVLGALQMEVDYAFTDSNRRISRKHCTISRTNGGYALIDHSTNGTFVNGKEVPPEQPVTLRRGDQISLANEVFLRFR